MKNIAKRAIVSIVIGAVVFLLGGLITRWTAYDMYMQAIFYLSGVIAAGCYWIGSNNNDRAS